MKHSISVHARTSPFTVCSDWVSKNPLRNLFFIVFLLFTEAAYSDDLPFKNKTIVGCENAEGYPPFVYESRITGALEGYSVELLDLVFEGSGANLEHVLLPWVRCLKGIDAGKEMDIVLTAASNEERRSKYIFSDAISKVHLAYFYDSQRYPQGLSVETPGDLDNLETVCGMRGWIYDSYGLSKDVYQKAYRFKQLVRMVIKKRCNAILVRYEVFRSFPRIYPEFEYHDRMRGGIVPWRKDHPIKFYFMAKKNSDYHADLIAYINTRMKQLGESGKLKPIKIKFGLSVD